MKTIDMRFKSAGIVCGLAFLAAVFPTLAQESHPPVPSTAQAGATKSKPVTTAHPSNHFTTMDANKDGRISATEYRNNSMAAFLLMDKDRDGKVSAVELTEAQPAASGAPSPFSSAHMNEIDTNKDSQLASDEASDAAARMFKKLDINHNEFLSAKELNSKKHLSDTEASAATHKTAAKAPATDKSK
jgi:Ca2+-binding EF-hand superfamily protein